MGKRWKPIVYGLGGVVVMTIFTNAVILDRDYEKESLQIDWKKSTESSRADVRSIFTRLRTQVQTDIVETLALYENANAQNPGLAGNQIVIDSLKSFQTYIEDAIEDEEQSALNPVFLYKKPIYVSQAAGSAPSNCWTNRDGRENCNNATTYKWVNSGFEYLRAGLPADSYRTVRPISRSSSTTATLPAGTSFVPNDPSTRPGADTTPLDTEMRVWRWDVQYLKNSVDEFGGAEIALVHHNSISTILGIARLWKQAILAQTGIPHASIFLSDHGRLIAPQGTWTQVADSPSGVIIKSRYDYAVLAQKRMFQYYLTWKISNFLRRKVNTVLAIQSRNPAAFEKRAQTYEAYLGPLYRTVLFDTQAISAAEAQALSPADLKQLLDERSGLTPTARFTRTFAQPYLDASEYFNRRFTETQMTSLLTRLQTCVNLTNSLIAAANRQAAPSIQTLSALRISMQETVDQARLTCVPLAQLEAEPFRFTGLQLNQATLSFADMLIRQDAIETQMAQFVNEVSTTEVGRAFAAFYRDLNYEYKHVRNLKFALSDDDIVFDYLSSIRQLMTHSSALKDKLRSTANSEENQLLIKRLNDNRLRVLAIGSMGACLDHLAKYSSLPINYEVRKTNSDGSIHTIHCNSELDAETQQNTLSALETSLFQQVVKTLNLPVLYTNNSPFHFGRSQSYGSREIALAKQLRWTTFEQQEN